MQQHLSWPETLAAMAGPLHLNPFTPEDIIMSSDILHVNGGHGARRGGGDMGTTGHAVTAAYKKDDRIPQWGYQETKDFIAIRSELGKDFTQTKRTKSLWEIISVKMRDRGHRRSAEQCKCKWKNLYNRYKAMAISQGLDSGEAENGRQQCPFYEELHAIFTEPSKSVNEGLYMESIGKKRVRLSENSESFSEEEEEEDEDEEESEGERLVKEKVSSPPIKKLKKAERGRPNNTEKWRANTMQDVLEGFFGNQQKMEKDWMEALERREEQRRRRDQEWRLSLEELEHQRLTREQVWRERDDQRRAKEEARAQQRDALFTILFSRLAKES